MTPALLLTVHPLSNRVHLVLWEYRWRTGKV